MRHALFVLCIVATPVLGQVNIENAWARATAPGAKVGAGYMTIRFDIPPRGSFELKPGGAHLMFVSIGAPFKEGEKIPVTLRFRRAGEVKTEFQVGRLADAGPPHGKH